MISARAFALSSCLLLAILGCAEDEGPAPAPVPDGTLFAPAEDIDIAGAYEFDRVIIPPGVTVRATGPLSLQATRSIDVQGTIRGEGSSVHLISDGEVAIRGLISLAAGDSAAGGLQVSARGPLVLAGAEIVSPAGVELSATGPEAAIAIRASGIGRESVGPRLGRRCAPGASGGSIVIQSERSIVLHDAWLAAAQGGDAAPDTAQRSDECLAATPGGRGGNVSISAGEEIRFKGQVDLRPGSGGAGGDVKRIGTWSGWDAEFVYPANATAGRGGDAGVLTIHSAGWSAESAAIHVREIAGGRGGSAIARTPSRRQLPDPRHDHAAANATAIGGRGGDVPDLVLVGIPELRAAITFGSISGGDGGPASASAGNGAPVWRMMLTRAGRGGDMTSRGGDGGDVLVREADGRPVGTGGGAGSATFAGGGGGHGEERCEWRYTQGADGGPGGDAYGGDGLPGRGLRDGATAGVVLRAVGNGGNGGEGFTSGAAGPPGRNRISVRGKLTTEEPSFQAGASVPPCTEGLGACVTAANLCVPTNSRNCEREFFGRFFPGEACSPNLAERYGCCIPGERCVYATPDSCIEMGGSMLPPGDATCWDEACRIRVGACCGFDGSCRSVPPSECRGSYNGDFTECDPLDCGVDPSGAYSVSLTVLEDFQRHEPQARWTSIREVSITVMGNTVRLDSDAPWVTLAGDVTFRGELMAAGQGEVAGVADVECHLEATFTRRLDPPTLRGIITLGVRVPPIRCPEDR
ncbi:MAG: hypothetical protein IPK72_03250 [Candidatus Eisenbacteria bacterium]|nr:hypothetical protein [Candidatus Eisenbacteria bacterium]